MIYFFKDVVSSEKQELMSLCFCSLVSPSKRELKHKVKISPR